MMLMVTLLVTVPDLGLQPGFFVKWLKAYAISAATAFCIMPPARRPTERIVALLGGRR